MEKSILIIGGTGCLSSVIVKECLKSGIATTIINRGNRQNMIPDGVELIKTDRNDFRTINIALAERKFTTIVDFLCYDADNVKASIKNYAWRANQYIFISSCAVSDFRKIETTANEESPKVDTRWEYSINKWKAEECLKSLSKEYKFNYTIIRPSITYGDTRIPYGITPPYGQHGTLIQRVLNGKPIIRWNKGENKCNMMHVEDFSRAFVALIGNTKAYNETFNICSEQVYTYNDVLSLLGEKLKTPVTTIDIESAEYAKLLPERKGEILAGRGTNCCSSMDKYKRFFPSFKEKISLVEGISKTIDAYIAQNWQDGMNYYFDGETDRIIYKIIGGNKRLKKKYNLKYIDYLNEGKLEDRKEYYRIFNKFRFDSRLKRRLRATLSYIYHLIR